MMFLSKGNDLWLFSLISHICLPIDTLLENQIRKVNMCAVITAGIPQASMLTYILTEIASEGTN